MYKLKLGKSLSLFRDGFFELVKEAKTLGFDAVDFDLCGHWHERAVEEKVMNEENIVKGLKAIEAEGLILNGVHISFGPHWDVSSPDEEKRVSAVEKIKAILPVIDAYQPNCYILHGSYEPIADEVRPAHLAALKKSLCELVRLTNTTIAVETLPRTCLFNTAAEAVAVLDELNLPTVRCCVDVNHFLREKAEDAVLAIGGRIVSTHISDHDYVDERHLLPGEGKIDWIKLIGALKKTGYQGVFNYESAGTLAEIKENYEDLFRRYNKE